MSKNYLGVTRRGNSNGDCTRYETLKELTMSEHKERYILQDFIIANVDNEEERNTAIAFIIPRSLIAKNVVTYNKKHPDKPIDPTSETFTSTVVLALCKEELAESFIVICSEPDADGDAIIELWRRL